MTIRKCCTKQKSEMHTIYNWIALIYSGCVSFFAECITAVCKKNDFQKSIFCHLYSWVLFGSATPDTTDLALSGFYDTKLKGKIKHSPCSWYLFYQLLKYLLIVHPKLWNYKIKCFHFIEVWRRRTQKVPNSWNHPISI